MRTADSRVVEVLTADRPADLVEDFLKRPHDDRAFADWLASG